MPKFKLIKKIYYDWKYPVNKLNVQYHGGLLKKYQNIIDQHVKLNLNTIREIKMKKICEYGLDNGKKLRPSILLSIFDELNKNSSIPIYVLDAAISIEYIHCASLIIDDIMDEDYKRRGKKCLHIKYGNTVAQLIAIQFVTMALNNICNSIKIIFNEKDNINKNFVGIFCDIISKNLNDLNMGQFMDISFPKNLEIMGDTFRDAIKYKKINFKIEDMIHKKTSSLFEISFIWAWLLTYYYKSNHILEKDVEEIRTIAKLFGLIFQICDDFEDVEQDLKKNGKNSVMNYVICFGPRKAKKKYYQTVILFIKLSKELNIYTLLLEEIITYLNSKTEKYFKYLIKNQII